MRHRTALIAAGLAALLTLAACGSDDDAASAGGSSSGADAAGLTIGDVDLSADCPEKVVIQTDWNPESEHGHLYQLLGSDYTVDADLKSVTGPLMSTGSYTGVDVEIRSGGPAIGFQTVAAQMYQDKAITMGYAGTDGQVQQSATLPVTAFMAPLDVNPQMIMWDPATYPEVKTIADLGKTDAVVRYFGGAAYMEYFISSGQLAKDKTDGGYDGTPANFVAAGGKDAQQGFASAEPYIYENEVSDWGKPVAFQLIDDAGWRAYAAAMSVRTEDFEALTPCLEKITPVLQQATVDYYADPAAANTVILDLVQQYDTGWVYSQGVADFSVEQQLKLGLVSNGDNDTLGDFDMARVQDTLDKMTPIATDLGTAPAEGLTVDDLVTNEFIDDSIGLP